MAFTIPNQAQSLEDPDGVWPQAQIDQVDIDIIATGARGDGVVSGCAVTAQGSPDMTVAVASGRIAVAGVGLDVASGNVTIGAAHSTYPRFDLVVVSDAALKSVVAGTAQTGPVFPAVPASSVALAAVYVPAGVTSIGATYIVDKRFTVAEPDVGAWEGPQIVVKAADESVTASTTLQNDDHLYFTAQANTTYFFRATFQAMRSTGLSNNYLKVNWSLPAGGTHLSGIVIPTATAALPTTLVSTDVSQYFSVVDPVTVLIVYQGWLYIGGTGGTARLQWAQQSASGVLTLKAGSFLEYQAVT